ncbi:hypothetical protein [Prescottella subtropica]|uniref:hypothetical protein n=1 Tax=Prescottella subtropica TaxID=2545757 RepID=UPI0010F7E5A6|nr:hypothetical protein [Prescottella subtropica]
MISILIGLVLPLILLLVAGYRVYRYRDRRETWLLTAAIGFLGAAKLARVPVVTDDYVDEWLHAITGIYNLCDFTGMWLGTLAATTFAGFAAFTVGGHQSIGRRLLVVYAAVTALMFGTFLMTPVTDTPTSYMTADFPMTGSLAAYWTVYLGTIGAAGTGVIVTAMQALRKVRRGPLVAGLSILAAAAAMAVVYVAFKIVDLYVNNNSDQAHSWYAENSKAIAFVLILGLVTSFIGFGGLVAAVTLPRRCRRYRLLRTRMQEWQSVTSSNRDVVLEQNTAPPLTRWAAWKASTDSIASHRLMVELSDVYTTTNLTPDAAAAGQ